MYNLYYANYVSPPLRFLSIHLLKLSGRPDSKDLMREGVEVAGIFGLYI
jgi:hypothetical protein